MSSPTASHPALKFWSALCRVREKTSLTDDPQEKEKEERQTTRNKAAETIVFISSNTGGTETENQKPTTPSHIEASLRSRDRKQVVVNQRYMVRWHRLLTGRLNPFVFQANMVLYLQTSTSSASPTPLSPLFSLFAVCLLISRGD